ncbi:MAG: Nif3-like dinuclear metal center hexameric protein [Fimbriimonadaceae bacterium]|nr:Nif3-like dinuclear metal center hexameric protein [Fimbriimonadaceae bacterium]
MMTVREVLAAVEQIAPPSYAFSWDRIGLQVGDPDAPVSKVAVSLDSGLGAIEFASSIGAELLVSHHPIIWDALKDLRADHYNARRAMELVKRGIAGIAAHTNWDCAPGGINDALANVLEMSNIKPFGQSQSGARWKLVVFVPNEVTTKMLDALSAAGAGVIGNYERCAFFSEGTGTFIGMEGSNPAVGQSGQVEEVAETRLEMFVPDEIKSQVERAMRQAHPYEEPAFDWFQLADGGGYPLGRIGDIEPGTAEEIREHFDQLLGSRSEMWVGHSRAIRKVAVIGGAAAGEWKSAKSAGADCLITGEVPQHVGLEASESGFVVLACGHYATEQPGMAKMARRLKEKTGLECELYTPEAGKSGRPNYLQA